MNDIEYKIEKHLPPSFPIYTSIQRGRENLVHNHCHSSMEIIKVLEGRIRLQIGAFYYECRKGDIIFILPSMLHGARSLTEDAAIEGIVFETSLINIPSLQLDFSELFHRNQRIQYIIRENDDIDAHYTEKIQISELSKLIHVCDDRLIRLFKEVIGETPVEYIVNVRVEYALKLLMEDDFSITEIAERSGFGSATYMTRVFKQKLGIPPGKCKPKHE